MQQSRNAPWSSLPTVAAFAACVYAFYSNSLCALLGSYDTGWIVRTGELILREGFPRETAFAWSVTGQPYVAYQWLCAVASAVLFQIGSLWLVGLAACLLTALLMFLVLPTMWLRRGAPLWMGFAFLALAQTPHWFNARPQLISFLLLSATIAILERFRTQRMTKWLFAMPPLMVIWVNCHSFWTIGLLFMAVYAIADFVRFRKVSLAMLATMIGACSAALLNPYGSELPAYLATFVDGSQYDKIYELQPWFTSGEYWWTLLTVPLAAFAIYRQKKQIPAEGIILSALTCVAALLMRRFEPVFIITAWPFLAQAVANTKFKIATVRSKAIKYALPAAALAIPLFTWYSHFPSIPSAWMVYTEDTYPLLKLVQDHAGDERIFCPPTMGSWMLAMNPEQPVFADSRFDAYPKRFLKWIDQCLEAQPRTLDRLDSIGIQHVVVQDNMPLAHLLISSPSWYLALDDGMASWWIRTSEVSKLDEWGINNTSALPPHIAKATAELRDIRDQHLRKMFTQLAGSNREEIR